MKKTLLEIYALAVCFVTLICFAIILGKGIYDVISITNPQFTLSSWEYSKFLSNEGYCSPGVVTCSTNVCSGKNDAQITKMRETAYADALENEKHGGMQGLVFAMIIAFINLMIFIPHWLIARKARV